MFWIILSVVMIVCGFIFFDKLEMNDLEWVTVVSVGVGIAMLLISGISFIYSNSTVDVKVAEYVLDVQYLESLSDNDQLSFIERERAVAIIMQNNKSIMSNRIWADSFLLGSYYHSEIGDLELLDYNIIPKSTNKMDIDINNN